MRRILDPRHQRPLAVEFGIRESNVVTHVHDTVQPVVIVQDLTPATSPETQLPGATGNAIIAGVAANTSYATVFCPLNSFVQLEIQRIVVSSLAGIQCIVRATSAAAAGAAVAQWTNRRRAGNPIATFGAAVAPAGPPGGVAQIGAFIVQNLAQVIEIPWVVGPGQGISVETIPQNTDLIVTIHWIERPITS